MEIVDKEALKKCRRLYSKQVVNIAEGMANLIEARMANGLTLEQAADQALTNLFWDSVVDWPTMHSAAEVLAKTWKHGQAFQNWTRQQNRYS
jgi:hypothetical protein